MSRKIKKSITVYVKGNQCNLRCTYCYEINAHSADEMKPISLVYDVDTMVAAFNPKRVGGECEITVIGSAETLLEESVIPFVHGLLQYGHVVTVVTNCTLTSRIKELVSCDKKILENLIVKASLHWSELKRRNLVEVYFNNLCSVIDAGASAYPFLTICEEYVPELEMIAETSRKYLGATPHCSPCMEVVDIDSLRYESFFYPACTDTLVEKVDSIFESKVFDEIIRNSRMNPQEAFCYAGKWSFCVDFVSGRVFRCHGDEVKGKNFYEKIDYPFEISEPIGCSCRIASCCLQYNFFSEGLIPSYKSTYMFGDLLYKEGLISEHIRERLNVRFDDIYQQLTPEEKSTVILHNKNRQISEIHTIYRTNPFLNEKIYQMVSRGKKIAIYGMGAHYKKYEYAIGFPVCCFLSSFAENGEKYDDKPVFRPEVIENLQDYFVIIAVADKQEIEQKLNSLGLRKGVNYI